MIRRLPINFSLTSKYFHKSFSSVINPNQKRLDVVIFGLPNAGKSTFLNLMIKEKVAAITHKRHTTRNEILGIYNNNETQLIFYDTPGFVSSKSSSNELKKELKVLNTSATRSLNKADVIILMINSSLKLTTEIKYYYTEMIKIAVQNNKEIVLVLNKIDLLPDRKICFDVAFDLMSLINGVKLDPSKRDQSQLDTPTFFISALKNDGVLELKNYLLLQAKNKPWLINDKKTKTTMTKESRVEETVLQYFMENAHEELPYQSKINCLGITPISDSLSFSDLNSIKEFTELSEVYKVMTGKTEEESEEVLKNIDNEIKQAKRIRIDVEIIVPHKRNIKTLVGHLGRTLLTIRQGASQELSVIFNKKVFLYIWIKAEKK